MESNKKTSFYKLVYWSKQSLYQTLSKFFWRGSFERYCSCVGSKVFFSWLHFATPTAWRKCLCSKELHNLARNLLSHTTYWSNLSWFILGKVPDYCCFLHYLFSCKLELTVHLMKLILDSNQMVFSLVHR